MADRARGSNRVLNLVLALVFAFLYVPIGVLVALSFNEGGLPTVWSGFSTKWYVSLASNDEILSAALNTLIVALVSTAIATLLGTLLAIGIETRRRKSRSLEALIFAPMIIPDIVLAIALLSFFSMLNVTMGLQTIILAHVVFNLAFVSMVVRARLKSFDWSIVEASADLGASAAHHLPPRDAAGDPCRPSWPARCSPSRSRSTSSSSPSSRRAPAAPQRRCRCRFMR